MKHNNAKYNKTCACTTKTLINQWIWQIDAKLNIMVGEAVCMGNASSGAVVRSRGGEKKYINVLGWPKCPLGFSIK